MTVAIRRITNADIPAGMRLKAQNGWNQLADDWRRQLVLEPEACFLAELDGQVVGTACACVFHTVAWVNLVLVDQSYRGRGIGTRLVRYLLAYLDERGIPTIRLDATPMGQPIYEKLGFVPEYSLTRFEGAAPVDAKEKGAVEAAKWDNVGALVEFDSKITGTQRTRLLTYLQQGPDPLLMVRTAEGIAAYATYRPGARAWQIGPCLGETGACRRLLTAIAWRLRARPVFMDIPCDHESANAFAAQLKLTPQRILTRMTRGPRVREQLDWLWCSFGPEKG